MIINIGYKIGNKPITKVLDLLQDVKLISLGYLLQTINAIHKALNKMNNVNLSKPLDITLKGGLNKRYLLYIILYIIQGNCNL